MISMLGQRVLTRNRGDVYQSLEQFSVELGSAVGVQQLQGQGSDLLGNSVRVVRWITDQLICKVGNRLSLCSVTVSQRLYRVLQ